MKQGTDKESSEWKQLAESLKVLYWYFLMMATIWNMHLEMTRLPSLTQSSSKATHCLCLTWFTNSLLFSLTCLSLLSDNLPNSVSYEWFFWTSSESNYLFAAPNLPYFFCAYHILLLVVVKVVATSFLFSRLCHQLPTFCILYAFLIPL